MSEHEVEELVYRLAPNPWPEDGHDVTLAVLEIARAVAERVEERMKERVCEGCGEGKEIAFDERINEGWCGKCDKPIHGITRAQFEAVHESKCDKAFP